MSGDQSDDYVDRYWSDHLATDAVALKIMKELYQDLRMKEGGAKRPPIINREVASYLATNFVYDLNLELARDNTNGDDFWCAWAVYEDKYEGT